MRFSRYRPAVGLVLLFAWLTPTASISRPEPRVAGVVAAWPAGPLEVRVAFDRAVDPGIAPALVGKTIGMDESARDRSRFQAGRGRPARNGDGPTIAAARWEPASRQLVLATDPHTRPAVYVLDLSSPAEAGGPPQTVVYDLSGVEAVWDDGGENAEPAWSGWWPELDPQTTRTAMRGSAEHERAWPLLRKRGRLTLRTLIALPPGKGVVRVVASQPIAESLLGGEGAEPARDAEGRSRVDFPIETDGDPLDLSLIVRTGEAGETVRIDASYLPDGKPRQPLSRAWLMVPWAPSAPPPASPSPAAPDFAGGDPKRGEAVFFGEAAKCAHCHQIGGKGGKVGPDLTAVFERPAAEVYRDVAEPSAVIRPQFVPYTVALKDGRVLAGIVRAEGADAIRLTDTEAKTTVIPRTRIEEIRPSATSVMPVGLVGAIGETSVRDLMAFLMKPRK